MQGLIDHGIAGRFHLKADHQSCPRGVYSVYFGLGQSVSLTHAPGVFNISLAGIRLGSYLLQSAYLKDSDRSFLDIGTGSGAHAFLARKLGSNDITATDICEKSIAQAKKNEYINFKQNTISFLASDLFGDIPERQFHTIVFNPPGWRTPSQSFIQQLATSTQACQLPMRAMFYGEEVVSRFLEELPRYLEPTGVAIVGLNSLLGIRDVLYRYDHKYDKHPPLTYKLVERHTFPLIHYTAQWKALDKYLKLEFENWNNLDLAAYSIDKNGKIYWSYEIIEFSHRAT
jgi:release factor glutamine methyltransferase